MTRSLIAQIKGDIEVQDNRPGTRVVLTVPLPARPEDDLKSDVRPPADS
jgi:signal transduction histidine kinase